MSARGEPRETQIPGGHVLTCFRASDCFKMLLVSTARSVRSGPLALAIITLFVSGCATPGHRCGALGRSRTGAA